MHRRLRSLSALVLLVAAATAAASAQSNSVPGMDIRLGSLGGMKYWGRIGGGFPNGVNGLSISTTACNIGTTPVGWFQPMATDHPSIAFLLVREENGRLVQISDRSYVKHGFFATNQSSCSQCPNPGSNPTHLLPGCSDTYSTNNNGDQYYLGAPSEIDPWLGQWTSQCSHFDRGEPAVPPPQDCDNIRSLTQTQAGNLGPVGHRINVTDANLNHPGAKFYYQGMYVILGEPEANRGNNLLSAEFTPTWNGSGWSLSAGGPQVPGSVLQRWSGATVRSSTNGVNDGRLFVAVVVTKPAGGPYHYEFAVHNRDNQRGVGAFRIPLHSSAKVFNVGFGDFDGDTGNDWTSAISPTELTFSTPAHPLEWNSIFNFWFDSYGPPTPKSVSLDQFLPGTGSPTVTISSTAPGDPCVAPSIYCTAKVNSLGCTPSVSSTGMPSATAGSGFAITSSNMISSTPGLFFYGTSGSQAMPFEGGVLCVLPPLTRIAGQNSGGSPPNTDCTGVFSLDFNTWIAGGGDPNLIAGATVHGQFWARDIHDPAGFGTSLSDAIEFTICQ